MVLLSGSLTTIFALLSTMLLQCDIGKSVYSRDRARKRDTAHKASPESPMLVSLEGEARTAGYCPIRFWEEGEIEFPQRSAATNANMIITKYAMQTNHTYVLNSSSAMQN